jgi:aminoglycoside 6'-N-acetyltransferase I
MLARIADLLPHHTRRREQAARLLVLGFREHWPDAWPDIEAARAEVADITAQDSVHRVALDARGRVIGWAGGLDAGYDGHVWELHPLVVHPAHQGQGIGRALLADLEARVRARGALTLTLGSDDEDGMTSLSGVDLYDQTWARIRDIQNLKGHPYTFYQKCGFTITGVMPDANGPGKPDILMSKRLF